MSGKSETIALIALADCKVGGRKYLPGDRFSAPRQLALSLIGNGKAQRATKADGRHRR